MITNVQNDNEHFLRKRDALLAAVLSNITETTSPFVVALERVMTATGYTRKDNMKRALAGCGLVDGVDYTTNLPKDNSESEGDKDGENDGENDDGRDGRKRNDASHDVKDDESDDASEDWNGDWNGDASEDWNGDWNGDASEDWNVDWNGDEGGDAMRLETASDARENGQGPSGGESSEAGTASPTPIATTSAPEGENDAWNLFWSECVQGAGTNVHFMTITTTFNVWAEEIGLPIRVISKGIRRQLERLGVRIGRVKEKRNHNVQYGVYGHYLTPYGERLLQRARP
ncbi:hypothetical protein M427DRAFT_48508 [Gonapodya prolifera JEL478]|uniref:Uncharacterized protein n=1 Tax=Gonapodya prolifera (strain JEL478) TaxID=1344416 RepID=A0A139A0D1_GONPJ|nr:hypothetical protein M427DRAFT_48508 [Gonapodya prolifera JEL478]|eukprot:KXS10219.1 hypothetical protein M427DRAFT_48508 [Gonapodya prolifera JEL478]